jgi:hypothetical protein
MTVGGGKMAEKKRTLELVREHCGIGSAKYYETPDRDPGSFATMRGRLMAKGLAVLRRPVAALRRVLFCAELRAESVSNCIASRETKMNTETAIPSLHDHDRDDATQLGMIRDLMLEASARGAWLTLPEIGESTAFGEASISAQLRHLRKARHGRYRVEKRQRRLRQCEPGQASWLWEYQVSPPNRMFLLDEGGPDAEACH